MANENPTGRGLLASLRGSAASLGAAFSQLATRKKTAETLPGPVAHKPVPEGPRWGPLVLLEKVGEGSFGEVYRAWDLTLEREVALKLMRAADEDPTLLQEARMLARLRHANVVTVYGVDRHDGRSGVWMDFVEGETLSALLEERGSFGAMEALLVGLDVCRALAAVHNAGLLHRDIKAQNVMRERGGRIVLMDFGLGREADSAPAEFGGTPSYMAPELFTGSPASVRSDVYAVGVLLFHLATRAYPVEAETLDALYEAHSSQAHAGKTLRDLRPDLPSAFVRAVEKAIATEPLRRYATAGQMTAALEAAMAARSPLISRRAFWWTAAPVGAAAAGTGVYLWTRPTIIVKPGASLLLTDISNATGDTQLSAITDVLRVQLAQSAHFNLLDGERIKETLVRMTRPDAKLDVPVAREVAFRSGTPLLVYGTLSPLGAEYGLTLVIERIEGQPRTPQMTERKIFEAPSKNGLFDAIHMAASWIRRVAGEAAKDISAFDTQPEEATTSSWEALDYLTRGGKLRAQNRFRDAMALYQEAVRVDPEFALAQARLAGEQSTQRLYPESFASYRKAVDAMRSRKVTRREELRIRTLYAIQTEDYVAAEDLSHTFVLQYPYESLAHHYHALALRYLARLEDAHSELLVAQKLKPSESNLSNLVVIALLLGRQDEAASYVKQLSPVTAGNYVGRLKFLSHDYEGSEAAFLAVSKGPDPRQRSLAFGARAALFAELGRYGDALLALEEGIGIDDKAGQKAEQARKLLARAHLRLGTGQRGAARSDALTAVSLDSDTSNLQRAGSLLARAGYPSDARTIRVQMNSPDEGRRFQTAVAILDAEIALAEGRTAEALAAFEDSGRLSAPVRPHEFLARAWERAGQQQKAFGVWRRIASSPALVWSATPDQYDPGLWSESLLRTADITSQLGLGEESRVVLERFLKLRYNADPGSPQSALATKLLKSRH